MSSIDDLTANVSQQGLLTLEQQRVLSLSGLAPSGPPGSVYRYKGNRSPFTAIGISAIRDTRAGADTKDTLSCYVERTIGNDLELKDLLPIRDKLVDVRLKASILIRKRLDRLVSSSKSGDDATAAAAAVAMDGEVTKAQDEFDSAWNLVISSVDREGIMILQTRTKEAKGITGRLGAIFGGSASSNTETGGFAVRGGLRTSFLELGTDFVDGGWPSPPGLDWSLFGTRFPFILRANRPFKFPWFIGQFDFEDCKVVTSKLEAKYVLYARDQLSERQVQANLKASVEQLKNIAATIREVEEVAIDATLSAVESLGNIGVLGPVSQRRVKLLPDGSRQVISESGGVSPLATDGTESWRSVYQVLSDYNEIALFVSGGPRFHFSRLTLW